jgi:hypothetical protein
MVVLLTFVISTLLTITSAQIPAFGRCPSVQVVSNFDATRVSEIIMEHDFKIISQNFHSKIFVLLLSTWANGTNRQNIQSFSNFTASVPPPFTGPNQMEM